MSSPIITLVLRTSDLTANDENDVGYSNSMRTTMTWRSIDFRNVLGNYYDEYDEFKIVLSQYSYYAATTTFGTGGLERQAGLRIQGLPFINYYESKKKTSTSDTAIIKYIKFTPTVGGYVVDSTIEHGLTFRNMGSSCIRDITLTYERYDILNQMVASTVVFPNTTFLFTITPIRKKVVEHHIKHLN